MKSWWLLKKYQSYDIFLERRIDVLIARDLFKYLGGRICVENEYGIDEPVDCFWEWLNMLEYGNIKGEDI